MKLVSINEAVKRRWLAKDHYLLGYLPSTIQSFIEKTRLPATLCALDLGKMKTGIAVSLAIHSTAIPIGTFPTIQLQTQLCQLNQRIGPIKGLVIGFPLALNGAVEANAMKRTLDAISTFTNFITENQTPIWFHDERYTSIHSKMQIKKQFNTKRTVDDFSATCILQEFLEIAQSHLSQGSADD